MSKIIKGAISKLGHPRKESSSTPASGTATPLFPHDPALESPVQSGRTSPTAIASTASRKSTDGLGGSSKNGQKDETDNIVKQASNKCKDLHEHFLAVKAGQKDKKSHKHDKHSDDGHASDKEKEKGRASTDGRKSHDLNKRPNLAHMKTEEDARALKVDKQEELRQEQLRREMGYKKAYEEDPLNKNYGFLNIDATPNAGVDLTGRSVSPPLPSGQSLTSIAYIMRAGNKRCSRCPRCRTATTCSSERVYRASGRRVSLCFFPPGRVLIR